MKARMEIDQLGDVISERREVNKITGAMAYKNGHIPNIGDTIRKHSERTHTPYTLGTGNKAEDKVGIQYGNMDVAHIPSGNLLHNY